MIIDHTCINVDLARYLKARIHRRKCILRYSVDEWNPCDSPDGNRPLQTFFLSLSLNISRRQLFLILLR
ncbi:hypothetical protein PEX1_086080 [Penicillium expansum]|uniref:Uncharacterized protein n=1 Tax=Penicillium expansum TaxID=27334 RepID=A0A0A2JCV1_PENEN|nr:hypothetical protein PEX2_058910 [Penicillium expansum]KGO39989.1 hypothetical protein PEXP_033720 [Penicillium expansum]KGO53247.1 hypothetical protein PEX2_058910 [Penicillium expansum]KGO59914.1 hypothetical protein PEX1_086080 [Penicillium expansum]